jgi:hypothetical protein
MEVLERVTTEGFREEPPSIAMLGDANEPD